MPYTLDNNVMKFATPQGFSTGDEWLAYVRDAFDVLYAEGAELDRPASARSRLTAVEPTAGPLH